jgi:resuscitation-promoting factor RpfB
MSEDPNKSSPIPPYLPTQKTTALDDTQPTKTIRPQSRRVFWFWLLFFVISLGMIVIEVAYLISDKVEDRAAVMVTLQIDGEGYPAVTEAQTVADFLDEHNFALEPGDILVPELSTAIESDMVIRLERARTVTVTLDGSTSVLRTTMKSPLDILRLTGQSVNNADKIIIDGTQVAASDLVSWAEPVTDLTIYRAVAIQVVDGDATLNLHTTGKTVGDALFEADITLYLADIIIPELSTPITVGMQILIDRSRPLTIIADGASIETRVKGQTVADALSEAGIVLSGLDYAMPGEMSAIIPDMTVHVFRITEEIITEQETIPYDTAYQAENSLMLDTRSVIQAGQRGNIEHTIRIRYEDGVELDRIVESEIMTIAPQNQIIAYGTQINLRTIDTPEGPMQYWRKLRVYTTSYHPAALGGSTTTSIGMHLEKGIIGIQPSVISYRTRIYVPGYGVGIAADTGYTSTPYWIDLGYSDHDYIPWWGWKDVYLLTPVPETINYLLPITDDEGGPLP